MPVSQELVAKLSDESITREEYDHIIKLIGKEVGEIWKHICAASDRDMNWWAFRNDMDRGNGNGSSGGHFDPKDDKEWIEIIGDSWYCSTPGYFYNDGFPTNFLWEDYKTTINNHVEDIKRRQEERRARDKERKNLWKIKYEELVESIKSKLTSEELGIIKIKKASDLLK